MAVHPQTVGVRTRAAVDHEPTRASRGDRRGTIDRRTFLNRAGVTSALTLGGFAGSWAAPPAAAAIDPSSSRRRQNEAYRCRMEAAQLARQRRIAPHVDNGDEARYSNKPGSYSKGLPHDALGDVDLGAYAALLSALETADPQQFEGIPMAGVRKLVSPQAAFAFDLEGADAASLALAPAPALASAEAAGELAELYWMALARDVPFTDYAISPVIATACGDLSQLSDFRGPKVANLVTPSTLFRGSTPGDLLGPFVSQFLWQDIPMGALRIPQLMDTAIAGADYLTVYADWLASQNGAEPATATVLDPTQRYIRDLRDLAQWVHVDALYQAYHQACLILLSVAPGDPGLPYLASATQDGFATFGGPHILSLVTEVATRALKAVWYQKWLVHRRLRPEAMGALVHQTLAGIVQRPLHADILNAAGPAQSMLSHGTYLLPQAFAEGCPLHPSYGAGHATVAGACVTILKAWFDESFVLPTPVIADATGLALQPYSGPPLTVGNELNKLAANVAIGRNAAGIHYRSDYFESLRLGEQIALTILEEQKLTYNEAFTLTLTLFDGTTVEV